MTEENKVENTEEETVAQAAPQGEAGPAELTLNDLNAMKSIIDVASQRGSFKPSEMVIVGQTYNKLTAFLNAAQTTSAAQSSDTQGEKNG